MEDPHFVFAAEDFEYAVTAEILEEGIGFTIYRITVPVYTDITKLFFEATTDGVSIRSSVPQCNADEINATRSEEEIREDIRKVDELTRENKN
jgi:hypothetical protein